MRLQALVAFYRWRLRVHMVQELFAGVGVAVAVALVFAVIVANGSITSSASAVAHAVTGPAQLQLHARGPDGLDERLLTRVEHLAGVRRAAPLLEVPATLQAPSGRQADVTIAGTEISLAVLDGLVRTLPLAVLSPGGIGLSASSAGELGVSTGGSQRVRVMLRGRASILKVSTVLGRESAGALSQAQIAVMPLAQLQRLAQLHGRVSRIIVDAAPGHVQQVDGELRQIAGGRISVTGANQDVSLLRQALGPSNQASDLFAGLAGLLGFLFAFNAMLLTVPERRQAIASLRMDGTRNGAIVQMTIFQGLCLGVLASLIGLAGGYALSRGLFHQSPGYLTKAFTLGTSTVVGAVPVVVALTGGILASCFASLVPLWDLRGQSQMARDPQSIEGSVSLGSPNKLIATLAAALVLAASLLFAFVPAAALIACVLLALATVAAVPVILALAVAAADAISLRNSKLTALPLAIGMLKGTTLRSLALAATGAVALFGSIALGASRDNLLRGIYAYTAHYAGSANVWLVNPADHQATSDFPAGDLRSRIAQIPGVAGVSVFQGSYLDYANRRVWVIAWPPDSGFGLLRGQIIHGRQASAIRDLGRGEAITVSDQIAAEHHVGVGGMLALPTPAGTRRFKIAATTTNFGWSPGAILMGTSAYQQAWGAQGPSALGVKVTAGSDPRQVSTAIRRALGAGSGLEVLTAKSRETAIDHSASEGLSQLGEIAWLLVASAILAMIAALGSSIWQRRAALAEMRLDGAQPRQRMLVLTLESGIMLGAGCLTGTVAGIYGQVVIDGYLKHVTGFPVAGVATGTEPVEIFFVVVAIVLVLTLIPGWLASRAPAALALHNNG